VRQLHLAAIAAGRSWQLVSSPDVMARERAEPSTARKRSLPIPRGWCPLRHCGRPRADQL